MSSVAKIFVVVNLVFSLVAFGSAATLLGAQDDYKVALGKKIEEFTVYKTQTQQQMDDLVNQKNQQTNKASEESGRASQLQQQVEDLNTRLANANTLVQTLSSSVENFGKELATANDLNKSNKEFLDKLSAEAKSATEAMLNATTKLDKEVENRVGLEQQVTELTEQVTTVSAEKGDCEAKLRDVNFWLGKYREKYGPLDDSKGAAGVVNAVKGNLVSISVGSAAGVRLGDNYNISRGSSYVGRIRITTVDKTLSVGIFDDQHPGSGAPPMPGDKATPGTGD
jgi:uncharacterized coiled-coil DUF342 family protein